MYNHSWPAKLVKVGIAWKLSKRGIGQKNAACKLDLEFSPELAEALADDAPKALDLLKKGTGGATVNFNIPCGGVNLILSEVDSDSAATITQPESVKGKALNGPDGPTVEVTAKWECLSEDSDDILDFLLRHMGDVEVQLRPRQGELFDETRKAVEDFRRSIPEGSSVTLSTGVTLSDGGRSVTVNGKGKRGRLL